MMFRLRHDWRRAICTRLRAARLAAGLTQVHLAVRCRLHLNTIQKVEQGLSVPDLSTMMLWCANTGISANYITDGLY